MKMEQYPLALIVLGVALTGCASKPHKPALADIPQTPLTVKVKPNITANAGLRVVNRAATAKMVGLKTVVGILGMFGGAPINGFKKEQLKGEIHPELPDPSQSLLPNALQTRLRSYAQAHPDAAPPVKFEVEGGEWLLVYQELSNANTLYELRYTATVWAHPADSAQGQQRTAVTQICQPKPQAMTLEAWQASDFSEMKKVADSYVAECTDAFTQRFPQIFS